MSCFQAFENLCKKIICPVKHQINEQDMIRRKLHRYHNQIHYQHFTTINSRSQKISCLSFIVDFKMVPTVLYLHGNGGHKLEALQLINENINLIAFDFSGCGKSQGDFISYGEKEVDDIRCVVQEIKVRYADVGKIALWGRSMGASLAIMYASQKPKHISCLILDSPFRTLEQVVSNVAGHNNKKLPDFLIKIGIYLVRAKITKMINEDAFMNDFLMHLNLVDLPALFLYSTEDEVVTEQNVRELYDSFKNVSKELTAITCSPFFILALHHQDRTKETIQNCIYFITNQSNTVRSTRSSTTSISIQKRIGVSTRIF